MHTLLRIHHDIASKCELDLHLPVHLSGVDSDAFLNECKIRSVYSMISFHADVVQSLMQALIKCREFVQRNSVESLLLQSLDEFNKMQVSVIYIYVGSLSGK